jgi:hypothetical protein
VRQKIPKNFKLFQPALGEREAAATMACNRIIPLWDTKGKWVGSATATRIGNKAFLFTAAHLISDGEPVQVLQSNGIKPIIDFRRRACVESGSDLAFLELTPEDAGKLRYYVEEGDIVADFDTQYDWPVVLAGCSESEYVRIAPRTWAAVASVTEVHLVPVSDWPPTWPTSDYGPPTEERDLLVAYPKETYRKKIYTLKPADGRKLLKRDSPSPRGLSGGGIWLELHHEKKVSGLRYPDIKLVGIQVAFCKRHCLCRCNRIGPLLKLVAHHYPELQLKIQTILQRRTIRMKLEEVK